MSTLGIKRGFVKAWRKVGGDAVAPLMFGKPPADGTKPPLPSAYATIKQTGTERHSLGEFRDFRIDVIARLPEENEAAQEALEAMLANLHKSGRTDSGFDQLLPVDSGVTPDPKRYGGAGVLMIPLAWTAQVEVLHHRS